MRQVVKNENDNLKKSYQGRRKGHDGKERYHSMANVKEKNIRYNKKGVDNARYYDISSLMQRVKLKEEK